MRNFPFFAATSSTFTAPTTHRAEARTVEMGDIITDGDGGRFRVTGSMFSVTAMSLDLVDVEFGNTSKWAGSPYATVSVEDRR